ncbi:hypothetical protein L211DRAFT_641310 [Terfezia boudieri ATCC MYA-4762]|uniref:Uncharacterized protein n=1 Tax=Terfezia boudieri ATCC MYA-4762 TaxID=1051890 RepID=A0A3N4L8N8_9PEZI|nr:hypothetical protein L211DRAFT_641310 [Terfezia boudieri ATCC MYA-4762]
MGVSSANLVHNTPNKIMLEACDVLGYKIEEAQVNTGRHRHRQKGFALNRNVSPLQILSLTFTLLGHHLLRLATLPRAPPPLATNQPSNQRAPVPSLSNLFLWLLPPTHPHAPIHPHLGPVICAVIIVTKTSPQHHSTRTARASRQGTCSRLLGSHSSRSSVVRSSRSTWRGMRTWLGYSPLPGMGGGVVVMVVVMVMVMVMVV